MDENKRPNNQSAFPYYERNIAGDMQLKDEGMTLRDYFAAKAMQAYISTYGENDGCLDVEESAEYIANMAYNVADKMLKQREL